MEHLILLCMLAAAAASGVLLREPGASIEFKGDGFSLSAASIAAMQIRIATLEARLQATEDRVTHRPRRSPSLETEFGTPSLHQDNCFMNNSGTVFQLELGSITRTPVGHAEPVGWRYTPRSRIPVRCPLPTVGIRGNGLIELADMSNGEVFATISMPFDAADAHPMPLAEPSYSIRYTCGEAFDIPLFVLANSSMYVIRITSHGGTLAASHVATHAFEGNIGMSAVVEVSRDQFLWVAADATPSTELYFATIARTLSPSRTLAQCGAKEFEWCFVWYGYPNIVALAAIPVPHDYTRAEIAVIYDSDKSLVRGFQYILPERTVTGWYNELTRMATSQSSFVGVIHNCGAVSMTDGTVLTMTWIV